MGVKFIKIDDASRAVIDKLIAQKADAGSAYTSDPAALDEEPKPAGQPITLRGIPSAAPMAPAPPSSSAAPPHPIQRADARALLCLRRPRRHLFSRSSVQPRSLRVPRRHRWRRRCRWGRLRWPDFRTLALPLRARVPAHLRRWRTSLQQPSVWGRCPFRPPRQRSQSQKPRPRARPGLSAKRTLARRR